MNSKLKYFILTILTLHTFFQSVTYCAGEADGKQKFNKNELSYPSIESFNRRLNAIGCSHSNMIFTTFYELNKIFNEQNYKTSDLKIDDFKNIEIILLYIKNLFLDHESIDSLLKMIRQELNTNLFFMNDCEVKGEDAKSFMKKKIKKFLLYICEENFKLGKSDLMSRCFESWFAHELMIKPTKDMVSSVEMVNENLIPLMELMYKDRGKYKYIIYKFERLLAGGKDGFGYGYIRGNKINLKEIKELLDPYKNSDFYQIINIQYFFWYSAGNYIKDKKLYCEKKLLANRKKYNKLFTILDLEGGNIYSQINKVLYRFVRNKDRGRSGSNIYNYVMNVTKKHNRSLGIMMTMNPDDQSLIFQFDKKLPVLDYYWNQDVNYQRSNKNSTLVQKYQEVGVPYLAGPSGMSTLFLEIMMLLGIPLNVEDGKTVRQYLRNYMLVAVSYLVYGGMHSLHETISPSQDYLKLFGEYKILKNGEGLANYNKFFKYYIDELDDYVKNAFCKCLRYIETI